MVHEINNKLNVIHSLPDGGFILSVNDKIVVPTESNSGWGLSDIGTDILHDFDDALNLLIDINNELRVKEAKIIPVLDYKHSETSRLNEIKRQLIKLQYHG